MHICFIGQYPYKNQTAGGVGTFAQTLAAALVKQDVAVTVIAYYPGIPEIVETENGIKIYWINQKKWGSANFIQVAWQTNRILKKIHKQHALDVVETQEAGLAFLKRIAGVRFVIRLHGGHFFFSNTLHKPLRKFVAWQERWSFTKADAFIGVSHFVLEETAKYISFNKSKAIVIPNPVDCTRFYAADPANIIPDRIVFAGRLVEKKGIRQLIAAMPQVLQKFPLAHLHIYGGDTTVELGISFKAILASESVAVTYRDRIKFLGEIKNDDMPAMLEKAALCVYPSHMEAMPIAWLEVMAMGKPLIAGRPGPGPEVINDGVNGLLCDPFSPLDISEKIITMLDKPDAAIKMGKKARTKILETYELSIITSKNLEFFRQLSLGPEGFSKSV